MKIMLYAETRSYLTTLKTIDYLFPIIIDTRDLGPAHSSEAFLTAEHSLLASWRIDDDQYDTAGMVFSSVMTYHETPESMYFCDDDENSPGSQES